MKLVSFHLMPYRPLDLDEAAKHRSAWVVLPNRLYDPVKGAEEYARHIDALVYAEELGFDAIGVNEQPIRRARGMGKSPLKAVSDVEVRGLLDRCRCPVPFHAVRRRFLADIASPVMSASPLDAVKA